MEKPQAEEQQTDFWVKEGALRPIWKVSSYFTLFIFLFLFLYMLGGSLNLLIGWRFGNPLFMLVAAVLPTLFLLRISDGRSFRDATGLHWSSRSLRQLGAGLLLSGCMLVLLFALELLIGDARMFLGRFPPAHILHILIMGFLSFALVGLAEEILMRGYPFDVLLRQGSTWSALLVTSVLFSLMHAMNPDIGWMGFGNILLAGIWLGVARLVTGSLWLAIGLHTGWNFFLGPVFGFPVSGIHERSLFITETGGPAIITGGSFGPEGGLLATVILLAGTAALFLPALRAWLSDPDDGMDLQRGTVMQESDDVNYDSESEASS